MRTKTVVPCIFRQPDEDEAGRQTWVRVEPSNWGITIAIFKERPTRDTPEWQAMAVVHIDPCFMNQVKVQLWDEYLDSERDEGWWITLVADVDGWRPRGNERTARPAMHGQTILVRLTPTQQIGLELELSTLFGLQVDDVLPTEQPEEKLLTFVVGPERMGQFGRIMALLTQKKASGAIIEVTVVASDTDEEGRPTPLSPGELVRTALSALEHVERGWLARELGDEHLEVIIDALQEYIERRKVRPRTAPLSRTALLTSVRRGEYASGVVAVHLGEIIHRDLEGLLDELSLLLTGSELLMDITYSVVGHEGDTLWLEVTGDATEVVGSWEEDEQPGALLSYRRELVVFTDAEARAIQGASALDPWSDQGASESAGHGFVLAAQHTELGEDVVIPAGVMGMRRMGLWIDGSLADALPHCQAILGAQRVWRAWPASDLLLVVPDAAYADPLEDPLIAQLAQALALAEVHTLEELRLAFVDLYEGYLIVWNERGQFETWEMLPDGRGLDQRLTERSPALDYQGDLYSYGNTYPSREESEQAIRKELEK